MCPNWATLPRTSVLHVFPIFKDWGQIYRVISTEDMRMRVKSWSFSRHFRQQPLISYQTGFSSNLKGIQVEFGMGSGWRLPVPGLMVWACERLPHADHSNPTEGHEGTYRHSWPEKPFQGPACSVIFLQGQFVIRA